MSYLRVIMALLTLGLSLAPLALWAGEVVGHATLVIGDARLVRAGQKVVISRDSDIQAGDQIETAANGQVMIRFVDNAKLSVRPASILHIQDYHYDALNPEQSVVRFELKQGTVRAISGEAAHRARDRFRLNTPLVAIGVRGTDFTAQVGADSTAVVVNQGAIRLAPLGPKCLASSLGACNSGQAKTLTASMIGVALLYRANMAEPSFQPLNSLKGAVPLIPSLPQDSQGMVAQTVVADSESSSILTNQVSQAIVTTQGTNSAQVSPITPPPSPYPPPPSPYPPPQSSLIWGRWSNNARPGDALTLPFLQAQGTNQVTVGDGYYVLFRQAPANASMPLVAGQAQFVLQNATASYLAVDKTVQSAQVRSGTLGIDFSRNTFSTIVNVFSSSAGAQTVQASGSVNPSTGIFVGSGAGAHVAGALSLDTLQAGYLFNKPLANGATLSGATLWGR